jgi:Fur family peroxide stress response transcriptional regulator
MNNYTNILREHNLKATPQRLAIAEALYSYGHLSVESLYDMMLQKFNSISQATIYKNINLMIENSFIQEVKIPHAKSVYELIKDAHAHLVCQKCKEVSDIVVNLESMMEDTSKKSNFKISRADLVFCGVCKKCQ